MADDMIISGGSTSRELNELHELKELLKDVLSAKKDLSNDKSKIEFDIPGRKSLEKFMDELMASKKELSKGDLFNAPKVQKEINSLINSLEKSYDKVANSGKKLGDIESENFINSFLKLKQYGDYFGKDFTSKFQEIFNNIKQGFAGISGIELTNTSRGDIETTINYIQNLLDKHPLQIKFETDEYRRNALEVIARQMHEEYQRERQDIIDNAELQRQQDAQTTAERMEHINNTKNKIKDWFNSNLDNIGEDEFFNINDEDFAIFQKRFGDLLEILDIMKIDTQDLEDLFTSFQNHVYASKKDIDSFKNKSNKGDIPELIELYKQIEEYQEEIARLQNELYFKVDVKDVRSLSEALERADNEIKELKEDLEYYKESANELAKHGYTSDEYNALAARTFEYASALEKAQQELDILKNKYDELSQSQKDTMIGVNSSESVNKKDSSKVFDSEQIDRYIDLLNEINESLKNISVSIGTIDDNNGFTDIISSVDILLKKLDEMNQKVGTGVQNITVNKTGITKADMVANEELDKLMSKRKEFMDIFGGESSFFNINATYGTGKDLGGLYSSDALNEILDPLQKINRLREFFNEAEQSLQAMNGFKKFLYAEGKKLKANINQLSENGDAYAFMYGDDMTDGQKMTKNAISGMQNQLKGVKDISRIIRNANKFEMPQSSAEELNNKINTQNIEILNQDEIEADVINLDKIAEKLDEIVQVLREIGEQEPFKELFENSNSILDEIIEKIKTAVGLTNGNIISADDELNTSNSTSVITVSANNTSNSTKQAADGIKAEGEAADEAKEKKEKFAEANKEVAESSEKTESATKQAADGIKAEGEAADEMAKSIQKAERYLDELGNTPNPTEDKLENAIISYKQALDKLEGNLSNDYSGEVRNQIQELYESLEKIQDKDELSTWASKFKVVAENVKIVNNELKEANQNTSKDNEEIERYINQKKEEYNLQKQLAQLRAQGYSEDSESINILKERLDIIKKEVAAYESLYKNDKGDYTEEFNQIHDKEQKDNLKERLAMEKALGANQKKNYSSQVSLLKQVNTWINRNSVAYKEYQSRLDEITNTLKNGTSLTVEELNEVRTAFRQIVSEAEAAGKTGNGLGESIKQRFQSLASYTATFTSFYDFIRYGRNFIEMLREFDTNFTEMRKVSDESIGTLKDFQKESFSIADTVGSTANVIQDSTADWMRLGESIEEAKESAKDASILLNVSEFSSIDEATTSLVAMSQAYQDMDKIDIIDKLNNIGKKIA